MFIHVSASKSGTRSKKSKKYLPHEPFLGFQKIFRQLKMKKQIVTGQNIKEKNKHVLNLLQFMVGNWVAERVPEARRRFSEQWSNQVEAEVFSDFVFVSGILGVRRIRRALQWRTLAAYGSSGRGGNGEKRSGKSWEFFFWGIFILFFLPKKHGLVLRYAIPLGWIYIYIY